MNIDKNKNETDGISPSQEMYTWNKRASTAFLCILDSNRKPINLGCELIPDTHLSEWCQHKGLGIKMDELRVAFCQINLLSLNFAVFFQMIAQININHDTLKIERLYSICAKFTVRSD